MLAYLATAGLLGVGWFGIMIASPFTRHWFLEQPVQNLGCMVVASIVVAFVCRKFIASAHTKKEHLFRAIVLPYLGAAVQIGLWSAVFGYRSLDDPELRGLSDLPASLEVPLMAATGTALSFFVVIPYGLVAQYVLARKAQSMKRAAIGSDAA